MAKVVGGFTVHESGPTELVLDFDLRQSIVHVHDGDDSEPVSYMLKPVIRVVQLSEGEDPPEEPGDGDEGPGDEPGDEPGDDPGDDTSGDTSTEPGAIQSTASGTYVAGHQCGPDPTLQAVYIFDGGVSPDDVDTSDDTDIDPVKVVLLTDDDNDGTYTGTAAFLPAGSHTTAYTCDPERDAPGENDEITFSDVRTLEVPSGDTVHYVLQ